MTPEVHSILIEARQRIARRVLVRIHFQDSNALQILDQLLLGACIQSNKEDSEVAPTINTEAVEAAPNCKPEDAEQSEAAGDIVKELEAAKLEIARLNRLREQDSKLIEGLRGKGA